MIKGILEPFIILPYRDLQDIVFFINESIRNEYSFLIDMAYRKLSNEILPINLIKVINRGNEIIVFHIYPTSYKEKRSGRMGQNLIIGYIINKKCFCRKYDNLICSCNLFFRAVMQCGCFAMQNSSIPTQFLFKINSGYYNEYINNYLNRTRLQMISIMNENRCSVDIEQNKRLKVVYDLIKSKLILFREYWILTDLEYIDYYRGFCKVINVIL